MRTEAVRRRTYWVAELAKLSGSFGDDFSKLLEEIRAEIANEGNEALIDHLRLCGVIPEQYGHDLSEEKLYSKYTDAIISETFAALGLQSVVFDSPEDSADVQARATDYSLVADAKAFRLSRTAKNQKDFKIQALDGWRAEHRFASVVCPIYQLPSRQSQIYQQAIVRNVCILSYSHLAVLVKLISRTNQRKAEAGLHQILLSVALMNPSKNAADYWTVINRTLVETLGEHGELWTDEKVASVESLKTVKEEALVYLRAERDRLLGLSHKQAVEELVRMAGLDSRIYTVEKIELGQLLGH